jgi:heavy metal sensor kinase
MKPLGLRPKLTILYTAVFTILLAAILIVTYYLLSNALAAELNEELRERTAALRAYLRYEDDKPVVAFDATDPEVASLMRAPTRYYQIYDLSDGDLVDQSRELQLLDLQFSPNELRNILDGPMIMDIDTDQGQLRIYNDRLTSPLGHPYLLQTGISFESRRIALEGFLRLGFALVPLGALLAAVSGFFMAGRALKPVQDIVRAAKQIEVSQLDQRLPIQGSGDEIDQLAKTFNETFARLDKAVGEMKQFTGSIAHELRTPLAALRGEAEIALLHGKTEDDFRRVLSSQLEEFQKLTRIMNQLLTLARAEAGELPLQLAEMNVIPMLQDLVEMMAALAAEKDVSLTLDAPREMPVRADKEWLERAILNLLDNAIKYTQPRGRVTVHASSNGGDAEIEIQDTGSGIPADALPHVFERFYRADPARDKTIEGVGLGLSLVKWIVDQHGGTIQASSPAGQGACFTIHLPNIK